MKILPLFALCAAALLPAPAYAAVEDVFGSNFVRTYVPGRPYAADVPAEVLAADSATLVSTVYYDGLGREVLAVRRGFGGVGNRLDFDYRPDGVLNSRRYTRYKVTAGTVAGEAASRRKVESTDAITYYGPFEKHNGQLRVNTGFGHWNYADSLHVWYVRDWKGSVRYSVHDSLTAGTID